MRTWFLLLFMLALLAGSAPPLAAQQVEDFKYTSSGGAVTITGYIGPRRTVEIPSTIADMPVKIIGTAAFSSKPLLTSVTIPDTVTSIEESAFLGCTGLTSVIFGNNLTSIGRNAFANCWALRSVIIPKSVTSIRKGAFNNCRSLTSIIIPDGITSIQEHSFSGCSDLASVSIGSGVTSIGDHAFAFCPILSHVVIPNSVTTIGNSAFLACTSLAGVSIGNNVTTIELSAFEGCLSLASIAIPDSVTSLKGGAFKGCRNLASVSIGKGVMSIESSTFSGCRSLAGLLLPETVKFIGTAAFAGCLALTDFAIPSGVTTINSSVFLGCTGLNDIRIPDSVTTIGDYVFRGCTGLTRVNIPNSIIRLGEGVFWECARLTSVSIPSSVTSIGDWAFRDCQNLLAIEIAVGNTAYRSVDGVLFNIGLSSLIQYPGGRSGEYVIPSGVTTVEHTAFERCAGLTGVTIPATVTTIGGAFRDCLNLKRATFEGDAPDSFDFQAFFGAAPLFTIYYYEGRTGFTSPSWLAYPTVALGVPGQPTLEDWRQQHFGPDAVNAGQAGDAADPDSDGRTNLEEFAGGTNPMNGTSFFQVQTTARIGHIFTVTFEAQPGRRYALLRHTTENSWYPVDVRHELLTTAATISLADRDASADLALYRVDVFTP